jgi:hypothetical protein
MNGDTFTSSFRVPCLPASPSHSRYGRLRHSFWPTAVSDGAQSKAGIGSFVIRYSQGYKSILNSIHSQAHTGFDI